MRRKKAKDDVVIYGGAAWGRPLDSEFPGNTVGFLQPHEYPDARTVALCRQHWPQASLSDYEVKETGPGRVVFIDRATGLEYLRDESLPLETPNPKATGIIAFVIDSTGRCHFLRPRAPREPKESIPVSSFVFGGPLRGFS